jgi:hypothetical protein
MAKSIVASVADFTKQVADSISIGDTTFTLNSLTDSDGVALADAKLYGFTIDTGVKKEYVVALLSSGTFTDVKSISRQGAVTTGFTKEHRIGVSAQITDHAALYRVVATLLGVSDLDSGVALKYDGAPAQTAPNALATVQFVLDTANGGAVSFNATTIAGVVGENVTDGDWVYFDESDGKWYLTDADITAKCLNVKIGKVRATTTSGNSVAGGIFVDGQETVATYVAGTTYYLSNTAGALATSAGTNSVIVGVGTNGGDLVFDTNQNYLPTAGEKSAFAGTLGTASSNNKYITELNQTTGGVDQSQTTQDATVIFGESDATTEQNKVAQSFIPDKTKIRGVSLYKIADSGTFTGTVKVALQADTAGSPSGSDLASVTLTNAQWLRIVAGEFNAIFTAEYTTLTLGSLYWIVLSTSTADNTNHPNVGSNSAGGYTDGSVKYNNTTDGWVAISTIDLYFKTLEGNISQVVETGTNGYVAPSLVPQLIGSDTTSVSIANGNSAAETTLFVKGIPAGLLGTRNVLRARVYFSALGISSAAEALTLKVKYGSTTLNTLTISGSQAVSVPGYLDVDILANNSVSAQIGTCQLTTTATGKEVAADASVGISKVLGSTNGTATENSATTLDLTITGQYGGTNASNDLTVLYGYVEVIRQ